MTARTQVIGPGEDKVFVIADLLLRITHDGGDGNSLSLSSDPHYVQLAAERGVSRIRCEAVSSRFLPASQVLTDDQIGSLRSLGWHEPHPEISPNYWLDSDVETDAARLALAQLLVRTLEVYGWSTSQELSADLILEDLYTDAP